MIVTSTSPSEDWGETFGDEVVAAPMIDGVVHHAEIRSLKGGGLPPARQGDRHPAPAGPH